MLTINNAYVLSDCTMAELDNGNIQFIRNRTEIFTIQAEDVGRITGWFMELIQRDPAMYTPPPPALWRGNGHNTPAHP